MPQEMALPTWFDVDFIQQIIHEGKLSSSEIKIIDFEFSPGLPAGNNHCSTIYQSNVQFKCNGKSQKKYFIIKALLEEGVLKEITEEGKFMEKECRLYGDFFPLTNELIGSVNISPKFFPSKLNKVLVLEDLRADAYVMCDKFKQLDFEHSLEVMKTLATFHAMSVAAYKKNPTLVSYLGEAYTFKNFENYSFVFMKEKLLNFGQTVEKWKGFEHFGNKIRLIYDTCCERLYNVLNNRNGFNVLNHGDLWTNNILFKYGGNKHIADVKLIDFQICMYGSLGIDLQYFTWTSVRNDVRSTRMNELYAVYLQTMNAYLEKLGCKERINEEIIKKEVNFSMFFGFFAVFVALNVIYSNDGTNIEKDVFDNSCYRETVEQILIYLDNNGFFT